MKWLCSFGIALLKRCIIDNKNLMTIVWWIRIYDYLRSNILMLRLICDQWVMMLDKWFVDVKVSEEVSIPAGITFRPYNTPCCKVFLCPYLLYYPQKIIGVTPLKYQLLGCYIYYKPYNLTLFNHINYIGVLGVLWRLSFAFKYSSKTVVVCFSQ